MASIKNTVKGQGTIAKIKGIKKGVKEENLRTLCF